MQKLWSSKSKRSQPLPPENEDESSLVTEVSEQEVTTSEKGVLISKLLKQPPAWLLLTLGIAGVVVVINLGLQHLTAPDAATDSNLACKFQIGGDWQTPFGKVTLQEQGDNLISGKYEYTNFERGQIAGELTGKLSNNVFSFDWKETPNKQPQQQGKGILVFGGDCKEFYGSYGTGESTNNFGNWQGSRLTK